MTDELMTMARLHITFRGEGGYLPDDVDYETSLADLGRIAAEAIATGSIPGIAPSEGVTSQDFADYTVDRMPSKDDQPPRLYYRNKTSVGA